MAGFCQTTHAIVIVAGSCQTMLVTYVIFYTIISRLNPCRNYHTLLQLRNWQTPTPFRSTVTDKWDLIWVSLEPNLDAKIYFVYRVNCC